MEVILVFQTDPWHTQGSKELVGVFTTEKKLRMELSRHPDFCQWDIDFMLDQKQNQTQEDSEQTDRAYELVIEKWESVSMNTLHIDS